MFSRMMVRTILLSLWWSVPVWAGQVLNFQSGSIKTIPMTNLHRMDGVFDISEEQWQTNQHGLVLSIVQFKNKIQERDRQMLQSYGVKTHYYIPDDAYLVEAAQPSLEKILKNPSVRVVLPMMAKWKKSTDVPKMSVFTRDQNVVLFVQLLTDDSAHAFLEALQRKELDSVHILAGEGNAYYLKMTLGQVNDLANLHEVLWIQNYSPMQLQYMDLQATNEDPSSPSRGLGATPGDYSDLTGYESGTKIMGFDKVWERGLNGQGQIVGMADTGLDSGNTDTLANDFRGQVTKGYSYGIGASTWNDPMGHGTHVAGSVMSNGAASAARIRGGAFGAQLIPEGMWSPIIDNLTVPPKLSKLFASVYADGARIHTNSWGGGQTPGGYDSYAAQVDDFVWNNPEMLILFAAGNNGVDGNKDGRVDENSMASPGSAKNVLTVGASENLINQGGIQRQLGELLNGEPWGVEPLKSDTLSNNPSGMAAFSSRGPCADGRIKPDVVGPGTNIVSNCSSVNGASPLWGNYNAQYCYSGGTSMSTPLVAGAAAVLRQYLAQEWKNTSPSAALMKAMLIHSADDMFPGQYGTGPTQELPVAAPNVHEGYGRVNIDRATTPQLSQYYLALIDQKQGVGVGKTYEVKVKVPAGDLKITLIYSDAPGLPNASKALVNNLDLEVQINQVNPPLVKTAKSVIDNVEQISFSQVPEGEITIKVLGVNVPKGREGGQQPFALVVSK